MPSSNTTKRSRLFLSPPQLSLHVVVTRESFGSCATPVNKRQENSSVDEQGKIRPAAAVDESLHNRRVRRIKRIVDGTPLTGIFSKDNDLHTTPVAAANFAAKPKNLMDVAEEEAATFNESLTNIGGDFKIPLSCAAATKQRRIDFDDLTVEDADDERKDAFGLARKFSSWSSSNRLQAQIKRQSFIERKGKESSEL